ncbi:MAG: hypothetical protein LWX83_10700, partial [Anaerolineae bacterium]|nr:hypothetical protein [Anaerolineae bacterium]
NLASAENITLAINYALDASRKPGWNLRDRGNLAVYYLIKGETKHSLNLYQTVLNDCPAQFIILEYLETLTFIKKIFPDLNGLQVIYDLLQNHLPNPKR